MILLSFKSCFKKFRTTIINALLMGIIIVVLVFSTSLFNAKAKEEYETRVSQYGRFDWMFFHVSDEQVEMFDSNRSRLSISHLAFVKTIYNCYAAGWLDINVGEFSSEFEYLGGLHCIDGRVPVSEDECLIDEYVADSCNIKVGDSMDITINGNNNMYVVSGVINNYIDDWNDSLNVQGKFSNMPRVFLVSLNEYDDYSVAVETIRFSNNEFARLDPNIYDPVFGDHLPDVIDNDNNDKHLLQRYNYEKIYIFSLTIVAMVALFLTYPYYLNIFDDEMRSMILQGIGNAKIYVYFLGISLFMILLSLLISLVLLLLGIVVIYDAYTFSIYYRDAIIIIVSYVLLIVGFTVIITRWRFIDRDFNIETKHKTESKCSKNSVPVAFQIFKVRYRNYFYRLVILAVCFPVVVSLITFNNMLNSRLNGTTDYLNQGIQVFYNSSNSVQMEDKLPVVDDFLYHKQSPISWKDIDHIMTLKGVRDVDPQFYGNYPSMIIDDIDESAYGYYMYSRNDVDPEENIIYTSDETCDIKAVFMDYGLFDIKIVDQSDRERLSEFISKGDLNKYLEDGCILIASPITDEDSMGLIKNDLFSVGDYISFGHLVYNGIITDPESVDLETDRIQINCLLDEDHTLDMGYSSPITVLITEQTARELRTTSSISRINISIQQDISITDFDKLYDTVKSYFNEEDLEIKEKMSAKVGSEKLLKLYQLLNTIFYISLLLLILYTFFALNNGLFQRKKNFMGTCLLLGIKHRQILSMILIEAAINLVMAGVFISLLSEPLIYFYNQADTFSTGVVEKYFRDVHFPILMKNMVIVFILFAIVCVIEVIIKYFRYKRSNHESIAE